MRDNITRFISIRLTIFGIILVIMAGFFPGLSFADGSQTPPPVNSQNNPPNTNPNNPGYVYKNQAPARVAPVIKVLIKKVVVSGNSLLTPGEISDVIRRFEGKQLSFQDSLQIAYQLTAVYRQHGYFLAYAYVPYQNIQNGILQVNVIEGKLGTVRIEGNKHYTTDFIKWGFAPVTKTKTLEYQRLQKALMLLDENSDLNVKSVLLPGKTPGTTDIVLKVEDKQPNHIAASYNNFGTLTGGQNQPNTTFSFGNLIGQGDMLTLNAMYPQPNKSIAWGTPVFAANYSVPIDNEGLKLKAAYSSADERLGASLDVLSVFGNTNIVSLGVAKALARADTHSSNFSATLYDKNSTNFESGAISSTDSVRSLALGYDANWLSGSGTDVFSATVTEGLGHVFGGSASPNPQASTPGASNTFTKIGWTLSRFQSLGGGYMVIINTGGQIAFDPLVSAEQFLIGGSESVRGYRPSEQSGDSGENATVEFRFPLITRPKSNLQLGLFIDTARVNNHYSTAGTPGAHHLTGVGAGLRANMGDNTSARFDLGWPEDPKPNATGERPIVYAEFSTQFL